MVRDRGFLMVPRIQLLQIPPGRVRLCIAPKLTRAPKNNAQPLGCNGWVGKVKQGNQQRWKLEQHDTRKAFHEGISRRALVMDGLRGNKTA